MATTIDAEPIYIGEKALVAKFFAMRRNPGDPRRIEGTFTIVGDDATLTLDAIVGPPGNPGQPSPIIRPQWGSTVQAPEDLPDVATLDETDRGRAWYINGFWHIYDEDDDGTNKAFHVVQGSIAGPPGPTPTMTVTAEVIEADGATVYGPIDVIPTGTTLAKNFHLKIPGIVGPEGPSAAIENASDYDGPAAEVGQMLKKLTSTTWGAADVPLASVEKYSIPSSSFTEYSGSAGRQLLAKMDIPAKDYDWYPEVDGHVPVSRPILSSAQLEIEVRIGITGSGTGEGEDLCGLGPFDPVWSLLDARAMVHIMEHWSSTELPTRAISPDSSVGRCLSGNPYTVYVFAHKRGGVGSYNITDDDAQLTINVQRAAVAA